VRVKNLIIPGVITSEAVGVVTLEVAGLVTLRTVEEITLEMNRILTPKLTGKPTLKNGKVT